MPAAPALPQARVVENQPRVLVVEDEPATQDFMLSALRGAGISSICANSVGDALSTLQRHAFAVTVLDWGLDRSGAEVLSVAKELYPMMPVLVVSGMPFEVRTDAVVNKADAFLNKPFSATVLVCQVKQLLERAQQAPSIPLPQRLQDIQSLSEVEEIYLRHVVALFEGNKTRAAEALGIHRQTVSTMLKEGTADPDIEPGPRGELKL